MFTKTRGRQKKWFRKGQGEKKYKSKTKTTKIKTAKNTGRQEKVAGLGKSLKKKKREKLETKAGYTGREWVEGGKHRHEGENSRMSSRDWGWRA